MENDPDKFCSHEAQWVRYFDGSTDNEGHCDNCNNTVYYTQHGWKANVEIDVDGNIVPPNQGRAIGANWE